jgi:CBS domain-containing protein
LSYSGARLCEKLPFQRFLAILSSARPQLLAARFLFFNSQNSPMPFVTAGQLARVAPTALESDPLALVADNLRHSNYGAIAVVDRLLPHDGDGNVFTQGNTHVLGVIEERDLSTAALPVLAAVMPRAVAVLPGDASTPASTPFVENGVALNGNSLNGHSNGAVPEVKTLSLTQIAAREVMKKDFGIVPAAFSLQNALLTLDRYNASALPVIDGNGTYRGMISRADVVAALGGQIRPPTVGGMATPLGVWLTDGRLQGGAPPLGLFLSGLTLAACFFVSHLALLLAFAAINKEWAAMFVSGRIGALSEGGNAFNLLVTGFQGFLFLLTLRLTPMAGIHAAEHQTVWAMERGLDLTPENVAQMPRAHPRCGTNLMALVGLVTIMLQHAPSYSSTTILLILVFTFFGWRQFGTFLQMYLTTRPPSKKQLESGIKAGREIMEKYQGQPRAMPPLALRLLNSGMALSILGMMAGMTAFEWLYDFAANWILGP